jgi:hypothetical protein
VTAADLLLDLGGQETSRALERRSILVTTNLAFKEWGTAAF